MSAEPVEIYLPCDVLAVKVQVGPAERLSVLEELALKAIHAGIDHFDQLERLFGLGPRPTLDLVYDLRRLGYLFLDYASGVLELTPPTREKADSGAWSELAGGKRMEEEREVMLDLITGQVIELSRLRAPPTGGGPAIVPAGAFDVDPSSVAPAQLLAVLTRVIEGENERSRSPGRRWRVLAAGLALANAGQARGRRYLPVEVTARLDEANGGLTVRVVKGGNGLPPAARGRLNERLDQLAEEQPDADFVRYLKGRAIRDAAPLPSFDVLLDRLTAKIDGLADGNRGLAPSRHSDLAELADPLDELCVQRSVAAVRANVIVGHEAHAAAVQGIIQRAERQLVLVCPWVRYDGLQRFLADLEAALGRGVQVFLLWGIKPGEYDPQAGAGDLRPDTYSALASLRAKHPNRFLFSRRSARTHAKLAIRDDREALVSSLNFLHPSDENVIEVGVTLSVPDRRPDAAPPPASEAVEKLLTWVRGAYPEYEPARWLLTSGDEFGPVAPPAFDPTRWRPPCPRTVAVSDGPVPELRDEIACTAVRLWEAAWAEYRRRVAAFAAPRGTRAAPVINGENRNELWSALRTTQVRLLIASDQIGPEVVDDRFVQALEERLQAGAVVSLIYRRKSASAQSSGIDPTAGLAELAARYPGRCHVVQSDTHAKVLVADDRVVLGSFNFLSYEGYYGEGSRFRQRSEVSVMLTGGGVADRVIEEVGRALPEAVSGWPDLPDRAPAPSDDPSIWSPENDEALLAELAEVAATEGSNLTDAGQADAFAAAAAGARLLEVVRAAENPWPLLDRLGRAGLPARLLRRSVAAGLTGPPPHSGERQQWLGWLSADCWRRSRFVEAAVLTAALEEPWPPELPHAVVIRIAAARSVGQVGSDLWDDAVLAEGLSPAARAALASAAAAELAARGPLSAYEALNELRPALPPAWGRVAEAVAHYWSQTGTPLPTAGLDLQAALEAAWQRLRDALAKAAAKGNITKFDTGSRTHHYLFDGDGAFARLRQAADGADAGAVADWLAREPVNRLGDYLDDATRAATKQGVRIQLIGAPIRESYLTLLGAVIDAARNLDKAAAAAGGNDARRLAEQAREVARVVHREWEALAVEAVQLGAPDVVLLELVRAGWRHLFDWGSQ
jgi:hypothetical protein